MPVQGILGRDGQVRVRDPRPHLAERASADFEEEIRAFVLEREGFRTAAEQLVEEARAEVQHAKAKLDKMLRAVTLASDGELDEADFQREVEPLKQDLKVAKRRLADAEEPATSREDLEQPDRDFARDAEYCECLERRER